MTCGNIISATINKKEKGVMLTPTKIKKDTVSTKADKLPDFTLSKTSQRTNAKETFCCNLNGANKRSESKSRHAAAKEYLQGAETTPVLNVNA